MRKEQQGNWPQTAKWAEILLLTLYKIQNCRENKSSFFLATQWELWQYTVILEYQIVSY